MDSPDICSNEYHEIRHGHVGIHDSTRRGLYKKNKNWIKQFDLPCFKFIVKVEFNYCLCEKLFKTISIIVFIERFLFHDQMS